MRSPSRLEKIGRGSAGNAMPRAGIALHAFAISAGWTRVSASYDWDGLKRGPQAFTLFQYTFAGEGRLRYENREWTVQPGQAMVLHFPHANRYWLPEASPGWDFLYVCLQGSEIVRLWRELIAMSGPLVTLPQDSQAVDRAVDLYERMKDGAWRSPYEVSRDAYAFAMALTAELSGDPPLRPRPPWLEKVERHLQAHLDREIPVEEMARVSGYSRYHFSRLFEHHAGKGPAAFLSELRMNRAAGLLRNASLSVREVAWRCGYPDANYFCKTFRKVFGMSPGDYRRGGY